MMAEEQNSSRRSTRPVRRTRQFCRPDLSTLAITLLKGVIYREGDERCGARC